MHRIAISRMTAYAMSVPCVSREHISRILKRLQNLVGYEWYEQVGKIASWATKCNLLPKTPIESCRDTLWGPVACFSAFVMWPSNVKNTTLWSVSAIADASTLQKNKWSPKESIEGFRDGLGLGPALSRFCGFLLVCLWCVFGMCLVCVWYLFGISGFRSLKTNE